jgi:hypothetical protein
MSQRIIAEITGVSQPTVGRDLVVNQTESDESVERPAKTTGKDGKQRPARKKPAENSEPGPKTTTPDQVEQDKSAENSAPNAPKDPKANKTEST